MNLGDRRRTLDAYPVGVLESRRILRALDAEPEARIVFRDPEVARVLNLTTNLLR